MPIRVLEQLENLNPDWLLSGNNRGRRSPRLAKKQKPNYFVAKPRPGKKLRIVKRQVSASIEPSITRIQRQEIANQSASGSEGLELITIDDFEEILEYEEEAPYRQNYSFITIDDDEEHLEHEEEATNQQNCSFMQEVERDYNEVISSSPDYSINSVDILLNDSSSPDDSVDVLLNDTIDGDPVTENSSSSGQDGNETIDLAGDPVTENSSNSGQDGNETIDLTDDEASAGPDLPTGAAPPQAASVFLSMGVGDAGPICPVCLDCFDNIKKTQNLFGTLGCGHVFCQGCITESVKSSNRCPMCRTEIKDWIKFLRML